MPGKQAARLGDTAMDCADPVDTPTGTVVAKGTVFINKMPAAKQGDQIMGTDIHIIMIPSPGGPVPTPLPHPFVGMIDGGTVPTVKIMGMPAAVVGSTATNNPPHIPQGGAFQKPPLNKARIIMGSPNVFIGSGSGGGGGGGSGSVDGGTDGIFNVPITPSDVMPLMTESHYIHATPLDPAGKQVLETGYALTDPADSGSKGIVSGDVRRVGVPEGEGTLEVSAVTRAAWSVSSALEAGAEVGLVLETVGMPDGIPVVFKVWERESEDADRLVVKLPEQPLSGNKAEASWIYELSEQVGDVLPGESYSRPSYYFTALVGDTEVRAPILASEAELNVELVDNNGAPLADAPYRLFVTDGIIKEGTTDGDGRIKLDKLPPRKATLAFYESPGILKCELELAPGPDGWDKATPELKISDLKWEKEGAKLGEAVGLTARIANFSHPDLTFEPEEKFEMAIFEYAADGSEKKIKVIEDVIRGETLRTLFTYPEKEGEKGESPAFFFTVKVRDIEMGAKQESGLLTRLAGRYTVKQNEDLPSIMYRLCGTTDTKPVMNHHKNKALFNTRTEHILYPGDELTIPDYTGVPWSEMLDAENPEDADKDRPLNLIIRTRAKGVLADMAYKLFVGGKIIEGKTDGDGRLKERVPIAAMKARLEIGGRVVKLELAGLDPPHTVRGVQGRLANLGYYIGRIDGRLGGQSKKAIRRFQEDYQLEVDGVVGPKTREELVKAHGC